MSFVIDPFVAAGVIRFEMTPEEVRAVLGKNFKSFKRTPQAALPCDYYSEAGVFVYYKMPGAVEAIEFASPASVEFEHRDLLAIPFSELKKLLVSRDPDLEIEGDSLISHRLGIGIYAPNADEDPGSPVESVIVFQQGYVVA